MVKTTFQPSMEVKSTEIVALFSDLWNRKDIRNMCKQENKTYLYMMNEIAL
jgi:hypothetical protein